MITEHIYASIKRAFETEEANPHKLRAHLRELGAVLLDVLPVAILAERLAAIDAPHEMSPMANAYRVIEHGRREAQLISAVEAMRERLAKDPP